MVGPSQASERLDPAPAGSSRWPVVLAAGVIAACAAAAYCNTFGVPLLLDDHVWITDNPSIRKLWPLSSVLAPSGTSCACRPLVNLSLALDYAAGGSRVWSYHATNLLVHVLSALVLFGLVRRTLLLPGLKQRFGARAGLTALVAALLWAVHPLQTASVTYIIQRCESLMGLFFLLVFYALLRGATCGKGDRSNLCHDHASMVPASGPFRQIGPVPFSAAWYLLAVAACWAAAGCKEIAVVAPVLALLYDRTFLAGSFRRALRARWGLYLGLTAAWGLTAWLLIHTPRPAGEPLLATESFSCWSYLLAEVGVVVHYLRLVFWPVGLCFDYGRPAVPAMPTTGQFVAAGVLLAGLFGLTCWALWRRPAWGFLGAWFFVILAPTSSFLPLQDTAFEHRMYLPLAALATTAAVILVAAFGAIPARTMVAACAAAVLASTLGALTYLRNQQYATELQIWQDTVDKAPQNWRAHCNLGKALLADGDYGRAAAECRLALQLGPDEPHARDILGMAFFRQKKIAEAIVQFRRAVELPPDFAAKHNNLGSALRSADQPREAIAQFREALRLRDDDAETHFNLGSVLWEEEESHEALEHLRRALALGIQLPAAHYRLATALRQRHEFAEAAAQYRQALAANPDYAAAHNDLAGLFWQQGDTTAAVAHYRQAVALKPDYLDAFCSLAGIHLQCGDAAAAIASARRADELSAGRSPPVLDMLAEAYARNGQFREAIATAQRALALARKQGDAAAAVESRERLETYRRLGAAK